MYHLLLNANEFNHLADAAKNAKKTVKFYILSSCLPDSKIVDLVNIAILRAKKKKKGYRFNFYSCFTRGERNAFTREDLKTAEYLFIDMVNAGYVSKVKESIVYENNVLFEIE